MEAYKPGQALDVASLIKEGETVDVAGTTVGKGFQGEEACAFAWSTVRCSFPTLHAMHAFMQAAGRAPRTVLLGAHAAARGAWLCTAAAARCLCSQPRHLKEAWPWSFSCPGVVVAEVYRPRCA